MKRFDRINLFGDMLQHTPIHKEYVIQHNLPKGIAKRQERLEFWIGETIKGLTNLGEYSTKIGQLDLWRMNDINYCSDAFLIKHCELDFNQINLNEVGHNCGKLAREYFFGTWKNGYTDIGPDGKVATHWNGAPWDKEQCRKSFQWVYPFNNSLLCAFLINDIGTARRIAEWPDDDLWDKYAEHRNSKEDIMYITVLGKIVCGDSWENRLSDIEEIREKSRRRPKLLLDALEMIVKNDSIGFHKTMEKYIKYFLKNESALDEGPYGVISLYGAILWNYARVKGLTLPELSEDIMDRIVTRESVGL